MCVKSLITGTLVGGVVFFMWNCVSWMTLPLHSQNMHHFKTGDKVAQVLVEEATSGSGIYMLPTCSGSESMAKQMQGPFAFISLRTGKTTVDMGQKMLREFAFDALAAFLLSWLTLKAGPQKYACRVGFLATIPLVGAIPTLLANWNWWEFATPYTLASLLDVAIGSLLVALVLAKLIRPETPNCVGEATS